MPGLWTGALALWVQDGLGELRNGIIILLKGVTESLSPSSNSLSGRKNLPEAPMQTPYFIGQNWGAWALLAESKTEKASVYTCLTGCQGRSLRSPLAVSGSMLPKHFWL